MKKQKTNVRRNKQAAMQVFNSLISLILLSGFIYFYFLSAFILFLAFLLSFFAINFELTIHRRWFTLGIKFHVHLKGFCHTHKYIRYIFGSIWIVINRWIVWKYTRWAVSGHRAFRLSDCNQWNFPPAEAFTKFQVDIFSVD